MALKIFHFAFIIIIIIMTNLHPSMMIPHQLIIPSMMWGSEVAGVNPNGGV